LAKLTHEKKIQKKSIEHAHRRGIRTIRMYFGPGMQTGWPDVLFLIPGGNPLFIEYKSLGQEPSKKQYKKIGYLKEAGYEARWTDNLEESVRWIDRALQRKRKVC